MVCLCLRCRVAIWLNYGKDPMNVYVAGYMSFLGENAAEVEVTRSAGVSHVLESFFYIDDKKLKLVQDNKWHMLLDSGAYTAFSKGAKIDVQDYIKFVKRTEGLWDVVAGLDVIGDADASWRNFEIMRDAGILTMPTFHYGEPWEFLDKMVEAAPYVAIGGVAQLGSGPALVEWLDSVWSNHLVKPDGTPRVKVHGFAVTGKGAMLRYPWASVDSTSWLQMAGHGTCALDLRRGNKITDLKVAFSDQSPHMEKDEKHFDSLRPAYQNAIRTHLENLGYKIEDIRRSYRWRQHVNIGYFKRCEIRCAETFVRQQPGLFF